MTSNWYIVGIDPAPTKDAVLCHGTGGFDRVRPQSLRAWFDELLAHHDKVLIAWDAPLSFESRDFYDRKIDKAARKWASTWVKKGRIAEKAINARPFAGLPHWAISCHTLGHPFGVAPGRLRLAERIDEGHCLVEVHPAVALAVWWIDKQIGSPLERYKNNKREAAMIAEALGFSDEAGTDDDHLDAYVGFILGKMLLRSKARWVGSVKSGGYVLPDCSDSREIEALYSLKAQVQLTKG